MAVLGCIADDFTGATDLAGILARSGVGVNLRLGTPTVPAYNQAPIEVIALKIRSLPADEAVHQAREALSWLKASGATRFFWKYCSTFDSTDAGNIGPVAEALMQDMDLDQTIYCPAFPANGRTVYMGNLFVGPDPLAESQMQYHPLNPMRDSNLMRLLEPQVTRAIGHINWNTVKTGQDAVLDALADCRAAGQAHVIIDALTDGDLGNIAKACHHLPLLTGGSAIGQTLPDLLAKDGMMPPAMTTPRPLTASKSIVLSGSCSAQTNAQVDDYLSKGAAALKIDPVELSLLGFEPMLQWLSQQDLDAAPMIFASAHPNEVDMAQTALGPQQAGQIVENALAACALAAHDAGAARFVVAGGETSGAVASALGISELDVGAEIVPGVPWTFSRSGENRIALALKSGNFGAVPFFTDALMALKDQ